MRIDSAHSTAEAQRAAKQRHFISVIDEGVYQRGVFKRLGKRKKVKAVVEQAARHPRQWGCGGMGSSSLQRKESTRSLPHNT